MNGKVGCLSRLEQHMAASELSSLSSEALRELAQEVAAGQRILEGYLALIATAAQVLDEAGSGSAVSDVMRAGGEVSNRRAKQLAARAEVAAKLPTVGNDLVAGAARPENIDAIARRTARMSSAELARLAVNDHDLAARARSLPPETFDKYLSDMVQKVADDPDHGPSIAERQRAASEVVMGRGRDGMWWLRGTFDDERGTALNAVINNEATSSTEANAASADVAAEGATEGNCRAAALYRLATGPTADGPRPRMGIGYIVDARTLGQGRHDTSIAQTWSGDEIDPAATARLACDADCYGVLLDTLGQPEAVGRTRRTATREQRLQLRALYRACPLDGTPFGYCEIHHVNVPWEHGGETELHNLLPISVDWHHRIHDRGWTLKMAPDRALKLWRPDGTLDRSLPPPTTIRRE